MHMLDFFIGLSTGLAFAALALQRVRAERAVTEAARTLERDAQTKAVVARERHAAELQGAHQAHHDEVRSLRERFAVEVRALRGAVADARGEVERSAEVKVLVERIAASISRVEVELRRHDRGRQRQARKHRDAVKAGQRN
jgi:hypothetical protein